MKIKYNDLARFIADFNLEGKEGAICFEAIIMLTTTTKQVKVSSEVHILRLEHTGMELIYLLSPEVAEEGIPDKIDNVYAVNYKLNEFLYINGTSPRHGNYVLSIHPAGTACEPLTLRELHAKTYN